MHPAPPPTVTFKAGDQDATAHLIDVSLSGAKMQPVALPADYRPAVNAELEYSLLLDSEQPVTFRAVTRWAHRFPEGYVWGVRFSAAPESLSILLQKKLPAD